MSNDSTIGSVQVDVDDSLAILIHPAYIAGKAAGKKHGQELVETHCPYEGQDERTLFWQGAADAMLIAAEEDKTTVEEQEAMTGRLRKYDLLN